MLLSWLQVVTHLNHAHDTSPFVFFPGHGQYFMDFRGLQGASKWHQIEGIPYFQTKKTCIWVMGIWCHERSPERLFRFWKPAGQNLLYPCMYVCICIYIYIFVYIFIISLYIYVYTHTQCSWLFMCVFSGSYFRIYTINAWIASRNQLNTFTIVSSLDPGSSDIRHLEDQFSYCALLHEAASHGAWREAKNVAFWAPHGLKNMRTVTRNLDSSNKQGDIMGYTKWYELPSGCLI